MSSALNRNSTIQCFDHGGTIEIHDEIIYTGVLALEKGLALYSLAHVAPPSASTNLVGVRQ